MFGGGCGGGVVDSADVWPAGAGGPPWPESVAELRDVVIGRRSDCEYGLVEHIDRTKGIDLGMWQEMHTHLWRPYSFALENAGTPVARHIRRDFMLTQLGDAYGLQLLGPGHPAVDPGEHWDVESLGDGYRLVSHTDPAGWFAQHPSLELIQQARRELVER